MAFIDYYKILGVDKNIPQNEVKAAFRKRTKQFHPDLHPNDPKAKAKFQALTEAYDVIGDPEKRKKYDRYGERWKEAEAFNNASGGNAGGGFYASSGTDSGFEGFDFSSFTSGNGGFSSFFEELFGGRNQGTQAQAQSRVFNADVQANVNIDLYTALLGGEIIVQTAEGTKLKLKVKPETLEGTKVRLRGKGRTKSDGTAGDLILTYHVSLPTNLNDKQKELLQQMRDA